MYRGYQVLEDDDLLLGEPSDGDLKYAETSVKEEGKADDDIGEGKLHIHGIKCDEESQGTGTCVSHEHFTGEEIEYEICRKCRYHGKGCGYIIHVHCAADGGEGDE